MAITINSNIAALNAQRRLTDNTRTLNTAFQRLSSGLRINHASDDVSGLAISQDLNAESRIFNQGIRNFNDGLSMLNIGESALSEATSIVTRVRELATQSANGTLSNQQRKALGNEANALVDEYNRILGVTDFNGRKLFDGSATGLRIQGTEGLNGGIAVSLGTKLAQKIGDRTADAGHELIQAGGNGNSTGIGDLNNDGLADLVSSDSSSFDTLVGLSNGDGTFRILSSNIGVSASFNPGDLIDMDGDGNRDLLAQNGTSNEFLLFHGNGDGTFKAAVSYDFGLTGSFKYGDVLSRGRTDVVKIDSGIVTVFLANGNGTFRAGVSSQIAVDNIALADFNGDGILDYVGGETNNIYVGIGRADGTFAPAMSSQSIDDPYSVSGSFATDDYNEDGIMDLVVGSTAYSSGFLTPLGGSVKLFSGLGNGTFGAGVTLMSSTSLFPALMTSADLENNGHKSISIVSFNLASGGLETTLYYGNGNGTFVATTTDSSQFSQAIPSAVPIAYGDQNGDGVLDPFYIDLNGGTYAALSGVRDSTALQHFSIFTQKDALAAMPKLDAALARISAERGAIGAAQSRIGTAINNLQQGVENYKTAYSRIADADIAEESGNLTRGKILQDAAAAVLGQANQLPALALLLLR